MSAAAAAMFYLVSHFCRKLNSVAAAGAAGAHLVVASVPLLLALTWFGRGNVVFADFSLSLSVRKILRPFCMRRLL